MRKILAPRSPEKPPPRSLPLVFSSEQRTYRIPKIFSAMQKRFLTSPTTKAITSMPFLLRGLL